MVRVERALYLASPAGRAALAGLPRELETEDPVQAAARLRRTFGAAEAAALGEQLALRGRARARFGALPVELFTAEGLEMMTHPAVAARRAQRLKTLGLTTADLTCGLGGDLSALLAAKVDAFGVERDAATAVLGAANSGGRVVRGDALSPPCRVGRTAVVLDPSRRVGGVRTFDPRGFAPPWDACLELLQQARAGVLKAPPGLAWAAVPPWCEVEAVQLGRDLRELALWAGASVRPGLRRAVLLPGTCELTSEEPASSEVREQVGRYLHDPESCVTRAGLVEQLAAALDAWRLDVRVAYLSGDEARTHPMCATFEVLEVVDFGLKRLRELLRARGWQPGEIRRRAFPVEPDELRRGLGQLEGEPMALVCLTAGSRRLAVIGRRVRPERAEGG
ncbi:MAG: S-adenosylmethionine-dependent methyltransferase [Tepidiforma sp.]|nr:MAG: S-adenosylmethionine-dependent methyltransferase [Tepidiforma sp.]